MLVKRRSALRNATFHFKYSIIIDAFICSFVTFFEPLEIIIITGYDNDGFSGETFKWSHFPTLSSLVHIGLYIHTHIYIHT